MDVNNMLAGGSTHTPSHSDQAVPNGAAQAYRDNTPPQIARHNYASIQSALNYGTTGSTGYGTAHSVAQSPGPVQAKNVRFELLVDPSQQQRARLPMRIGIQKHDALADISETVKNFYGLYDGGMSFEDRNGSLLIPTFDNVEDKMLIYVRTIRDEADGSNGSRTPRGQSRTSRHSLSPRKLQPPFQMMPPNGHNGYSISRPSSRNDRNRSRSPQSGRGRRSESTHTNPKSKSRGIKKLGSFDQTGNESDSDGVDGSVASSRRSKIDMLASADISVDNIVEGGRRKRAKFDSSELPLFVPPQVPTAASLSSVSPQRRVGSGPTASPFSHTNQHTFSYTNPLPSPQSHGPIDYTNGQRQAASISGNMYGNRNLRARPSVQYVPTRHSINGVLPTPDPTIGGSMSVISDEDVALQLMRLGDASNFSSHGRTSTSTLDDAFSGKADAASSVEESSDEFDEDENDLPNNNGAHMHHHHAHAVDQGESSGEEYDDQRDSSFKGESDPIQPDEEGFIRPKLKKPRLDSNGASRQRADGSIKHGVAKIRNGLAKSSKPKALSTSTTTSKFNGPISPTSLPPSSRKASNASLNAQYQLALGPDEEDLSAKPRCQRCRKSKKGCDRQRPCGRCKDAGIGIDGCVSEDEGNGRKGRYGRHMGVIIKKEASIENLKMDEREPMPMEGMVAVGGGNGQLQHQHSVPAYMPAPIGMNDKGKKRKR